MRITYRNDGMRSGFTLLELLASMAILAMIVGLLFAAFSQASRGWQQAENRVETFVQARAALDYMSRELSQAIATTNISFLGSANSVAFIAPVSTDPADGVDLEEIVYQLNGTDLERGVGPFSGPNWNFYADPQFWPATPAPNPAIPIAENIVSLRFSYVDATGNPIGPPSFWNSGTVAAWSGIPQGTTIAMTNRAPAGVQIQIEVIDNRAAKRLQPGMSSAVSNNIIKPAKQTFSTFVAIPNRQP